MALVLSIKKEESHHGFITVLYRTFVEAIQKNLGQGILLADQRAIIFLLDFINSIHHLEKGTRMDQALLKFFKDNELVSVKFCQKLEELKKELREKIKGVYELADPSLCMHVVKKSDFYASTKKDAEISDCFFYDVEGPNQTTWAIEATLYLNKGWLIYAFDRQDTNSAKLASWLRDNGILLVDENRNSDHCLYARLPFEESEEVVAAKYNEFLKAIADKLGKK